MTPRALAAQVSHSPRQLRSFSLRFAAALSLGLNLGLGDGEEGFWILILFSTSYILLGTIVFVIYSRALPAGRMEDALAIVDATLVVSVLFQHILAAPVNDDHEVTASVLVVAFILLTNTGLSLGKRHVLYFSSLVTSAWIAMLALMAWRHGVERQAMFLSTFFNRDLAIAVSFAITGWAVHLIVSEQEEAQKTAVQIDLRRQNLSRFFSPHVVSDLESASTALALERRNAAIMFVDLRSFSSYAEDAPPAELASVLAEYRALVARRVFQHRGTIDKFIGDGVMVVFGQPKPLFDDADRALACALDLTSELEVWRAYQISRGWGPALRAAIGLHYGSIVGGVLESGYHDELTVVGDAVNVAQRMERLTKRFDASLVVSEELLRKTSRRKCKESWIYEKDVMIDGRRNTINLYYIRKNQ